MPTRTTVRPGPRLPLVVTADEDLLDHLLRLAAAAGTEVDVAADPAAARPGTRPRHSSSSAPTRRTPACAPACPAGRG
jgi:hypothetical protein